MANKLYEETAVQAIANAIRSKNGESARYTIAQMAGKISNLNKSTITHGTFTLVNRTNLITINHGMNETPDMIVVFSAVTATAYEIASMFGVKKGVFVSQNSLPYRFTQCGRRNNIEAASGYTWCDMNEDITSQTVNGLISRTNNTSFTVGGRTASSSPYQFVLNTYEWFAIKGLI